MFVEAGEICLELINGGHGLFGLSAIAKNFGVAEVRFARLQINLFQCDL